ncbi:hypothetical protein [Labilibaculum euxinus]
MKNTVYKLLISLFLFTVPLITFSQNGKVIINDIELNETQLTNLENEYGLKPKAGNYWYDSKSGLYGVVGYASFGFMLPGHDFGELKSDASAAIQV